MGEGELAAGILVAVRRARAFWAAVVHKITFATSNDANAGLPR